MAFNFTLTPSEFKQIRSGNISVDIPVYNDLLGLEYDIIEAQSKLESEWNSKLLDLTEQLASERGLSVWEVSKLMGTAEQSTSEEDRFRLLGDHVAQFIKILSSRPSQIQKTYAIAAMILRRVDESVTVADVQKLPYRFLSQLVDFATIEQINGSHLSYEDLLAKSRVLEHEISLMRGVFDELSEITRTANEKEAVGIDTSIIEETLKKFYTAVDSSAK